MIIRSALLIGTVAPKDQADFDAYMRDVVVPEIGTYPGIRGVTLRKLVAADEGAPSVYMQFDLLFDSLADMDAALASPVRMAVRDRIKAGMAPFSGVVTHVVSESMVR